MWVGTGAHSSSRVNNFFLQLFCCYCHRSRSAGYCRNIFSTCQVYKAARSSVPSSALLYVGNLLNTGICSTQKLLWILLLHTHGSCALSFWVTGTTCFGSVDLTTQRLYQELVYRNKPFKEMITGSVAFSSLHCSPAFFVCVHIFSIQWT